MHTNNSCMLAAAVGRDEPCPETLCAYWETADTGGRANGCALRDIAPYLKTQPGLARHLVELRAHIERVRGF